MEAHDERAPPPARRPLQAPLGLLPVDGPLPRWLMRFLGWLSGISLVEAVAARLDFDASAADFSAQTLRELGVSYGLDPAELRHVPESGGVVIVANHPYGGIDGLIAMATLLRRRPDLMVLANGVLTRLRPLAPIVFPVDPFGRDARGNARSVRLALRHVAAGGALFTFPAGEVAHVRWNRLAVADPAWTDTSARILQLAAAPVVPMHFSGANSAAFQLAGLLHPRLRTLLLAREITNKQGRHVRVRIGAPVSARRIARLAGPAAISAHLRASVQLLARAATAEGATPEGTSAEGASAGAPATAAQVGAGAAPPGPLAIAPAVDAARMAGEIAALAATQRLAASGAMQVYCASAAQVPAVLEEIGRLRELSFRAVGEGTGRSIDLDAYDDYYEHLFIWHAEKREIVGAYRIGRTDQVRQRYGRAGLYLASVFEFRDPFFLLLGPALELGRSFIRVEYQRSYAPLLLLWKGISEYVGRNPRYARLIGAASVSNQYNPLSRSMLVEALRAWRSEPLLASLVRARRPFRPSHSLRSLFGAEGLPEDMDALGSLIEDREPDGKGVPVLLRHYLRLGARTIGFNIDTDFGHSLDCLIVLDLRRMPQAMLAKYMSEEALRSFCDYWGRPAAIAADGAAQG